MVRKSPPGLPSDDFFTDLSINKQITIHENKTYRPLQYSGSVRSAVSRLRHHSE
jgi:hypothetical protein